MTKQTTTWKLTPRQAEVLKYYRDGSPSIVVSFRMLDIVLRRGLIELVGSVFDGNFQLTKNGEHALKIYEM